MGSSLHIFLYGVPFKGVTNKENVMKQFRNLPYFVTSLGEVYRQGKSTPLKHDIATGGYRRVTLSFNGKTERFLVHRMVAELYVANPNPSEFLCINHIDHDPNNNNSSNLEWVNQSLNMIHCHKANRCSNITASKQASENRFKAATVKFKKLLGNDFISISSKNNNFWVKYKCQVCNKELLSRTDSTVFKKDKHTCRYCK